MTGAFAQGPTRNDAKEGKANTKDGAEVVWVPAGEFHVGILAMAANNPSFLHATLPIPLSTVRGLWYYLGTARQEKPEQFALPRA